MNVKVGTEAAQFLFQEHINRNFFAEQVDEWLTVGDVLPKRQWVDRD
jgi:hypothetical protein